MTTYTVIATLSAIALVPLLIWLLDWAERADMRNRFSGADLVREFVLRRGDGYFELSELAEACGAIDKTHAAQYPDIIWSLVDSGELMMVKTYEGWIIHRRKI